MSFLLCNHNCIAITTAESDNECGLQVHLASLQSAIHEVHLVMAHGGQGHWQLVVARHVVLCCPFLVQAITQADSPTQEDFKALCGEISAGTLQPLQELDQLKREQAAGRLFVDFVEGPIGFPPTFKVSMAVESCCCCWF